jgi:ATP-dependent protease ClpP protease subunit
LTPTPYFPNFLEPAVASSVTTMALTQGHVVDAASYSTAALAPYAAYQKHKLQGLGGMRGQQNSLRQNVNELQQENNHLAASVDQLEVQVTK